VTLPSWAEFVRIWAQLSAIQKTLLVCLVALDYYNSAQITLSMVRWVARRVRERRRRTLVGRMARGGAEVRG
jgi:hypothetical protein